MKHRISDLRLLSCWCLLLTCLSIPVSLKAAISFTQSFGEEELASRLVTAPNGQIYTSFHGQDIVGCGEPGSPQIPYKIIRFLVPDGASEFSVAVNGVNGISTYPLDYPIFPVQKDIPINDYSDELFSYPDDKAYQSLTTSFKAEVLEEMRIEGRYHVISVGLWPCAWSGRDNSLEICQSMQITLNFKENVSPINQKAISSNSGFVNIADIVVNPESVPQKAIVTGGETGPILSGEALPRYYIISERNLLNACEDLATWKTQKGYNVVRKAIEDIYADPRYKVGNPDIVDEAVSLRKYLQDEFALYGTFFCLLVGDHKTRMPIRMAHIKDSGRNTAFKMDHYIPTDSYFANLANDKWNAFSKYEETFFIEEKHVSFDPYIYIGRLLCHSKEQINSYTSKMILYESNPGRGNAQYLNKSLVTIQAGGMGYYNKYTFPVVSTMEGIFDSVECIKDSAYYNSTLTHFYPTGEMILNKINQSGYCSLMGHGEPTTIACSGENEKYSTWEYIKALESYHGKVNDNFDTPPESNIPFQCDNCGLDLMDNYDRPSIIYTLACDTEPFDIFGSFDVPHTMASSYTCGGEYGGVAYLGNTRNGHWNDSADLEKEFLSLIRDNSVLGISEAISKANLTNRSYVRASHNLIGDPELSVWLKSPSELSVSASWDDELQISGFDASGCTVVQNDGEGNVRRKKIIQMSPTYPVGYQSSGKMQVLGIFKNGFLPQVRLECHNDNLTECTKKFVVRSAQIGISDEKSVLIGSNANVDIKAVDEILTGQGLSIEEDGKLTLRCDKTIKLAGSEINSGGALQLSAGEVVLSAGFSVKAGGSLSIRGN